MFKRIFVMILSAALIATSLSLQSVAGQTGGNAELFTRARTRVESLGVGPNARVEVKLRDNTKLKGYVSAAEQDSFTVTNSKTGETRTVAYTDVSEVKKPGGGLSTKSWIIIGAAVAGAIGTWIIVKPALCDGGAQTRGIC